MDIQEIYNLIIASVPAVSSILVVFITFGKIISSLLSIKKSFDDNTNKNTEITQALQLQTDELRKSVNETQKQLKTLVKQVQKTVDRIDDGTRNVEDN